MRAVKPVAGIAGLALLATLLLGGGGSPAPLAETVLQAGLAGFAAVAVARGSPRELRAVPPAAWWLAGACLAVPMAQLVPLPPGLWQALPGRALAAEAHLLVGEPAAWAPWSLDPVRTLAALLAAASAVLVMLLMAAGGARARAMIAPMILVAAAVTLLTGTMQLAGGPDSPWRLYAGPSAGLNGLFANRNSTADLLLIAVPAAALVWRQHAACQPRANRGVLLALAAAIAVVLTVGVLLTGSRTGIALLPLALGAALAILRPWWHGARRWVVGAAALIGGGLAIAGLAGGNAALGRVGERFEFSRELRVEIWRDSLVAARQAWPWGNGMGTYVASVLPAERLEVVRQTWPNRAHDEPLELAIEGGLFALAAAAGAVLVVAAGLRRAWVAGAPDDRAFVLMAGTCLAILLAHSLVDYPLRSMALAGLAAACAGAVLGLASARARQATGAR